MEKTVTIVTVGHVDHGKSSVIGRLLADGGVLPKGKLEAVKRNCEKNSRPFEYAFLLDALKCEQSQGITLDIARCFFAYEGIRYEILDAPGHLELLKNMVTGASHADAALMVIDATKGIEENTRQHGYYLKLLGVKQIVIAVNKLDCIDYARDIYEQIKTDITDFFSDLGLSANACIPVSSMGGDNIINRSDKTHWYEGDTVIEAFARLAPTSVDGGLPLRLPIQGVYKFTEKGDERRIFAGTVASGEIKTADNIVFYPSGKRTSVSTLESLNGTREVFATDEAAGFTVTEQIIVNRGEIACKANEQPPLTAVKIRANVFWLGKNPLTTQKTYIFKLCTSRTEAKIDSIESVLNASTLKREQRDCVEKNQVATVVIALERPVAFDIGAEFCDTSRFVLVDDYEIAGGGRIVEALSDSAYDGKQLRRSAGRINSAERSRFLKRKGAVIWLTGLSGSGKTTIACDAEYELIRRGINAYVLDGDELRSGLNSDLGFSAADRNTNVQRTAYVAKMFKDAGIVTLVTLISPFSEGRQEAKRIIGHDFYEVFVNAPIEVCRRRDPKKLYSQADKGTLDNFTGKDSPYEIPLAPDLVIDTGEQSEIQSAETLLNFIFSKLEG